MCCRRRLPPRYYRDPYDYDDYPPPRRLPPPSYYRDADPYPPPRRSMLPYDDYPPPRQHAAPERLPTAAAPAAPVYYDFADDNVEKPKPAQQIDPLAGQHVGATSHANSAAGTGAGNGGGGAMEMTDNRAAVAGHRDPGPDRCVWFIFY